MICLAGRYDIYNDELRWSGAFAASYLAVIALGRSNETDRFCAVFSEILSSAEVSRHNFPSGCNIR